MNQLQHMAGVPKAEWRDVALKGCGQAGPEEQREAEPQSAHHSEALAFSVASTLVPQTISASRGFCCCPHADDSQIFPAQGPVWHPDPT